MSNYFTRDIPVAPEQRIDERLYFPQEIRRNYSLCKALLEGSKLSGLEREVHQELERIGPADRQVQGMLVPAFAFAPMRRDLTSTANGADLVPKVTEPTLIELLRPKMVVGLAGCSTMNGLVGNVSIPRQTGAGTATWSAENTQTARTSLTFGSVPLQPQRLSTLSAYAQQLLVQTSIDVENVVRDDMLKILAIEIDRAALVGTGSGDFMPTGLFNLSENSLGAYDPAKRSPSVAFGGVAPTFTKIVRDFPTSIFNSSIEPDNSMGYITTPQVKRVLRTTLQQPGDGTQTQVPEYIWKDNNTIGNVPAFASKNIDNNALGTLGVPILGLVAFGKWSELVIASWAGGVDVVVDPYTLSKQFLVRIVANSLVTVAFNNALGFSVSSDTALS